MPRALPICPLIHDVRKAEAGSIGYAARLNETLSAIQRAGASSGAVLGATIPIQYLSFFRRVGDDWVFFDEPLQNILNVFERLRRPLVFQLTCNHLSRRSPLLNSLLEERCNLMAFANGAHPHDSYFYGTQISPLTLLTDAEIPVNRYRFVGLHRTLSALRDFHARTGLVLGVTLFGEAHQLYSDFKDGGGAEGEVLVTDYSAASVTEFQKWLAARFNHSLQRLNKRLDSRFQRWEDIQPPRSTLPGSILDYIDSYAHGQVPVEGWCSPMEEVSEIEVWMGDSLAGRATLGMSRPDVPEHLEEVSDLNTGFWYSLDFKGLPEGTHRIRVIAVTRDGERAEVGERRLTILTGGARSPRSRFRWPRCSFRTTRSAARRAKIRHWLDLPSEDLQVLYNPLADLWYCYRCHQVEEMLLTF